MEMILRYLEACLVKVLKNKMVFLSGPRQAGKTTLAEQVAMESSPAKAWTYINWDDSNDQQLILKNILPKDIRFLILDEIHKFRPWRNFVKGLYDKNKSKFPILVTGSGRLDLYQRGGDSLQGRYRFIRCYPLSYKEVEKQSSNALERLLERGPFPEPFLLDSEKEARIWSRDYHVRLVREDVRDLESVKEISRMQIMATRLPELVGAPLSLNALREDLSVSFDAVKLWMEIYERLFFVFRLYPWTDAKIHSLKKEAKHYHFDWTLVQDAGARFENLIAFHLLKWCHYQEDVEGEDYRLCYFRDKQKREVDFVLLRNNRPWLFVEAKLRDSKPSTGILFLKARFPNVRSVQVCLEPKLVGEHKSGVELMRAEMFLREFI